jgi:hypothetical protein
MVEFLWTLDIREEERTKRWRQQIEGREGDDRLRKEKEITDREKEMVPNTSYQRDDFLISREEEK